MSSDVFGKQAYICLKSAEEVSPESRPGLPGEVNNGRSAYHSVQFVIETNQGRRQLILQHGM